MSQFEGCLRRIRRARQHRIALGNLWSNFCDEGPFEVRAIVQRDGTGRIEVNQILPFPVECAIELGEMLYQLRAALDGTIYQAAVIESGTTPPPKERSLEFPICGKHADFVNSREKLGPLSEACRYFVESVQPYNTQGFEDPWFQGLNANRSLQILNRWARVDRHRHLHLVGAWPSEIAPRLALPRGVTIKSFRPQSPGWLRETNCIATFELEGFKHGMVIKANPNTAIDLAIAEITDPPAGDETLGESLAKMIDVVTQVVKRFEVLMATPGRNTPAGT